jgi:hypothetical protein
MAISSFRPSYSATSLFCAGSLLPSLTAVDKAGYEAAEGTVFHELIAEWQTRGRPDHWLGQTREVDGYTVEIVEEMFTHAEECLTRANEIHGDRYVETRVDLTAITPIPGQGGTCDLAFCRQGILDITDWKYGKGVQVFAYKNTQLMLYALGFYFEFNQFYDFQLIRMRIAQPRFNHWDLWEVQVEELLEFADWARERWSLAWQPDSPRTPSPKACQWCKVRLTCPALEVARQALVDLTFEVLDVDPRQPVQPVAPVIPPAIELTTTQLAQIYRYRKLMESWFSDIGDELIARGLSGEDLGGQWKVVEGRPGRRRWTDEEQAVQAFDRIGVDPYEVKLRSPAQVEKLVRAAGVRDPTPYVNLFTDRTPGKPALVPIGDARADLQSAVEDSFNG